MEDWKGNKDPKKMMDPEQPSRNKSSGTGDCPDPEDIENCACLKFDAMSVPEALAKSSNPGGASCRSSASVAPIIAAAMT